MCETRRSRFSPLLDPHDVERLRIEGRRTHFRQLVNGALLVLGDLDVLEFADRAGVEEQVQILVGQLGLGNSIDHSNSFI